MPINAQFDRRRLLQSMMLAGASALCGRASAADGVALPRWRDGEFHIHHIDTGRGNCALLILPDGTTAMIDAGAANAPAATSSEARPDASRRPGEWEGRYALRHVPYGRLDYFLTTHLHGDHIGDADAAMPMARGDGYRLTGVSDVDRLLTIGTLIDRGFPDYEHASAPSNPPADNYRAYLAKRVAVGRKVEKADVGSTSQITLRNGKAYPHFMVRILSANGVVWSNEEHPARTTAGLSENAFSIATRWQYGRFSYFSGGDLNADTEDGRHPEFDMESPVAAAAGRTEVAVADHHGYFDACGAAFVRSLDAQVFIIPAWDIGHPGSAQMQRLLGDWPGALRHDVFATDLLPGNELLNRRFAAQLKSRRGHVVVRVFNAGDTYSVHTVDSSREDGAVVGTLVLITAGLDRSRTCNEGNDERYNIFSTGQNEFKRPHRGSLSRGGTKLPAWCGLQQG